MANEAFYKTQNEAFYASANEARGKPVGQKIFYTGFGSGAPALIEFYTSLGYDIVGFPNSDAKLGIMLTSGALPFAIGEWPGVLVSIGTLAPQLGSMSLVFQQAWTGEVATLSGILFGVFSDVGFPFAPPAYVAGTSQAGGISSPNSVVGGQPIMIGTQVPPGTGTVPIIAMEEIGETLLIQVASVGLGFYGLSPGQTELGTVYNRAFWEGLARYVFER